MRSCSSLDNSSNAELSSCPPQRQPSRQMQTTSSCHTLSTCRCLCTHSMHSQHGLKTKLHLCYFMFIPGMACKKWQAEQLHHAAISSEAGTRTYGTSAPVKSKLTSGRSRMNSAAPEGAQRGMPQAPCTSALHAGQRRGRLELSMQHVAGMHFIHAAYQASNTSFTWGVQQRDANYS